MSYPLFKSLAARVFSILAIVVAAATLTTAAEEKQSPKEEKKFWTGNKLTQDQPFPARVIAVKPSWVGYHLLLEEMGSGERLCVARIWETTGLDYSLLEKSKETVKEEFSVKDGWIYLTPGIDVNRFSWSIGAWKLGQTFGDEDLLSGVLAKQHEVADE